MSEPSAGRIANSAGSGPWPFCDPPFAAAALGYPKPLWRPQCRSGKRRKKQEQERKVQLDCPSTLALQLQRTWDPMDFPLPGLSKVLGCMEYIHSTDPHDALWQGYPSNQILVRPSQR